MTEVKRSYRQIRAHYDQETIRVYQAYSNSIADSALRHGTFVSPPFSMSRMTWIKPSFLWMMYRCGWAEKDEGQKRVLAVDISRSGFEEALAQAVISHYEGKDEAGYDEWKKRLAASPVRIQWDPERDLDFRPLEYRSLQVGLRGGAVEDYVSKWIVRISDLTGLAGRIHQLVKDGNYEEAAGLLPAEKVYPLDERLRVLISASQ